VEGRGIVGMLVEKKGSTNKKRRQTRCENWEKSRPKKEVIDPIASQKVKTQLGWNSIERETSGGK